jgi:hypothetical protein
VARDQASKIQILSVKHRGLLQAVDRMFDDYASLEQVLQMIEREYHEKVSTQAVETYKKRHWQVQKDRIRDQKAFLTAIAEIIGKDGLDAAVNALLWQALQTMTPPQLIALKKVVNDEKKVELMKKQFALYAEEHRLRMQERKKASEDDTYVLEDFDAAQKVVQQVKEIFGIGTRQIAPPAQKLLGPAQEAPSPEAAAASINEGA